MDISWDIRPVEISRWNSWFVHLVVHLAGFSLLQHGDVFVGVLFELREAGIAAEANLGSVVDEDDGFSHGTELFPGNDADVEGVGRRLYVLLVVLILSGFVAASAGAQRDGDDSDGCDD